MSLDQNLKKLFFLFLSIAGLILAKEFLIPLCIGGVLATLFLPVSNWLENKKLPRFLAVSLCVLFLVLVISLVLWLIIGKISSISEDFSMLQMRFIEALNKIQAVLLDNLGISIASQENILGQQKDNISKVIPGIASSMFSILFNFFLILVYLFCLLYYRNHLKLFLLKLFPLNEQKKAEATIYKVSQVSQQYLLGLAKMIVLLWIMYGIGFSIIGVKNAIFFAILCGLLEVIPFIGNLTGTFITVSVAAAYGSSYLILLAIIAVYGVVQFIQGWFLEPLILGPQVKINPFFTIIALIIGELIWGLPGVFLAIPLMAMFKIVFDSTETLKPFGFLIGKLKA